MFHPETNIPDYANPKANGAVTSKLREIMLPS
jgi:hypothetical protein